MKIDINKLNQEKSFRDMKPITYSFAQYIRYSAKRLDYYPSWLVAHELCVVYNEYDKEQFFPYTIDKEIYIDVALPIEYKAFKESIIEDIGACRYNCVETETVGIYNIITFKSNDIIDYSKLPEKLYFYAKSPEWFVSIPVQEFYSIENVKQRIKAIYDWNISKSDAILKYNVYEIPFECCNAIKFDDQDDEYVVFDGHIKTEEAKLITDIRSFIK